MRNFKSILTFVFLLQHIFCSEIIASEDNPLGILSNPEKFYMTTGIHESNAYYRACELNYLSGGVNPYFTAPHAYFREYKHTFNEWKYTFNIALELPNAEKDLNHSEDSLYKEETLQRLIPIEQSNFYDYWNQVDNYQVDNYKDKNEDVYLFSLSLKSFDKALANVLKSLYPSMENIEECEFTIVGKSPTNELYVDEDFDRSPQFFHKVLIYKNLMYKYFSGVNTQNYSPVVEAMKTFYNQIKDYSADNIYSVAIEQTSLFSRITTECTRKEKAPFIPTFFTPPLFLAHYAEHQYGLLGSIHKIHTILATAIHASSLYEKTINYFLNPGKGKFRSIPPLLDLLSGEGNSVQNKPRVNLQKIMVNNVEGNDVNIYEYLQRHFPERPGKDYSEHRLLICYSVFMAFLNSVYLLENDEQFSYLKERAVQQDTSQIENITGQDDTHFLSKNFLEDLYNFGCVKEQHNTANRRKTNKNKLEKFVDKQSLERLNSLEEIVKKFDRKNNEKTKAKIFIEFIEKAKELGFEGFDKVTIPSFEDDGQAESIKPTQLSEVKDNSIKKKRRKSKKNNPIKQATQDFYEEIYQNSQKKLKKTEAIKRQSTVLKTELKKERRLSSRRPKKNEQDSKKDKDSAEIKRKKPTNPSKEIAPEFISVFKNQKMERRKTAFPEIAQKPQKNRKAGILISEIEAYTYLTKEWEEE